MDNSQPLDDETKESLMDKPKQREANANNQRKYLSDEDIEIIKNYVDRSTILGVKHVSDRVFPGRLIWFVVFCVFAVLTVYQMVSLFTRYFAYEVQTDVQVDYQRLMFPSFTICNLNPVRQRELHRDEALKAFIDNIKFFNESTQAYKSKARRKRRSNLFARRRRDSSPGSKSFDTDVHSPVLVSDQEDYSIPEDEYYEYEMQDAGPGESQSHGQSGKEAILSADIRHRAHFKHLLGNIDRAVRLLMSHQKEMMILSCSFGGTECSSNDFIPVISEEYNVCYQFNSAEQRDIFINSTGVGPDQGLTLILYAESIQRLKGYTQNRGFRAEIHPFKTMSFPYRNGFFVSPGVETNVGIKLMNVERLSQPYGECQADDTWNLLFNRYYTKAACDNLCVDQLIAQRCHCKRPAYVTRYSKEQQTLNSCNFTDTAYVNCREDIRKLIVSTNEDICNCSKECSLQEFIKTTSSINWPDETLWNYLKGLICNKNLTDSDENTRTMFEENCNKLGELELESAANFKLLTQKILRDNFALLKIYYTEWNYEMVSEKPDYDVNALLADLGGSGGLYLGMSVFTGAELLFFAGEIFLSCWRRKHRARAPLASHVI